MHFGYDEIIDLDSDEVKRKVDEQKVESDIWRIQHGEEPIFVDENKAKDLKLLFGNSISNEEKPEYDVRG